MLKGLVEFEVGAMFLILDGSCVECFADFAENKRYYADQRTRRSRFQIMMVCLFVWMYHRHGPYHWTSCLINVVSRSVKKWMGENDGSSRSVVGELAIALMSSSPALSHSIGFILVMLEQDAWMRDVERIYVCAWVAARIQPMRGRFSLMV